MSMELEYPFKVILFLIVVMILVGIMITFREKLMKICFFPPCGKESVCETNSGPTQSQQSVMNKDVLEKYCNLCWQRNNEGKCNEDRACYFVSFPTASNPSSFPLSPDVSNYCSVKCNRDATSILVGYDWIDKKVIIEC